MNYKLLSRPPFRYIQDIVIETIKATNFAKGLYKEEDIKDGHFYSKSVETKLDFLNKLIDIVELALKEKIDVNPRKIIAGSEIIATNLFLHSFYRAAILK
jgi:hypothetical protein